MGPECLKDLFLFSCFAFRLPQALVFCISEGSVSAFLPLPNQNQSLHFTHCGPQVSKEFSRVLCCLWTPRSPLRSHLRGVFLSFHGSLSVIGFTSSYSVYGSENFQNFSQLSFPFLQSSWHPAPVPQWNRSLLAFPSPSNLTKFRCLLPYISINPKCLNISLSIPSLSPVSIMTTLWRPIKKYWYLSVHTLCFKDSKPSSQPTIGLQKFLKISAVFFFPISLIAFSFSTVSWRVKETVGSLHSGERFITFWTLIHKIFFPIFSFLMSF